MISWNQQIQAKIMSVRKRVKYHQECINTRNNNRCDNNGMTNNMKNFSTIGWHNYWFIKRSNAIKQYVDKWDAVMDTINHQTTSFFNDRRHSSDGAIRYAGPEVSLLTFNMVQPRMTQPACWMPMNYAVWSSWNRHQLVTARLWNRQFSTSLLHHTSYRLSCRLLPPINCNYHPLRYLVHNHQWWYNRYPIIHSSLPGALDRAVVHQSTGSHRTGWQPHILVL